MKKKRTRVPSNISYIDLEVGIDLGDGIGLRSASVGIFKDAPLYDENTEEHTFLGGTDIYALKKKNTRYFNLSVSDSMSSILQDDRFIGVILSKFNEKQEELIAPMLMEETTNASALKRAENSLAALTKQGYRDYSKYYRVSEKRAAIKGFANAGIGTGQTIMSIQGRLNDFFGDRIK